MNIFKIIVIPIIMFSANLVYAQVSERYHHLPEIFGDNNASVNLEWVVRQQPSVNCYEDKSTEYYDCTYIDKRGVEYVVEGRTIWSISTSKKTSLPFGMKIGSSLIETVKVLIAEDILNRFELAYVNGYLYLTSDYVFIDQKDSLFSISLMFDEQFELSKYTQRMNW